MSSVFSLEDTMRRHDTALYEWLGGITVDYGTNADLHELVTIGRDNLPILRVFAAPDRAIASIVDLLVARGWIAGDSVPLQTANATTLRDYADKNFSVLPLPLITIQRNDPVANLPDSGVPKTFRRQNFSQAAQTWEQHQWPGAYETTYTVTFWSIKRYTEVFFREWLYSQMGKRGVGEQEVLVPVIHDDPWGTIRQRLVFEGSSDLSDLEGENARYMRFEYTLRLRTWHFRQPLGTVSYVHDLAVRECPVGVGFDSVDAVAANPTIAAVSLNMFSIYMGDNVIPSRWPKSGDATVRRSHTSPNGPPHDALRMTVETSGDEVLISNRAVPLDINNRAVLSLAFNYKATAVVRTLVASRDPSISPVVWITNRQFDLPAQTGWTKAQFFTLVEQPIFSTTLQGTGLEAIAHLADISLVHVRTLGRVNPSSSVPGGGGTIHSFTGLGTGAYLVVVVFAVGATSGSIDVGGTLYPVNATTSVGLVALFTPTAGAISVTVPSAIPTDDIYVQPYNGSWRGTDV